jgi:rare lipoprotein A
MRSPRFRTRVVPIGLSLAIAGCTVVGYPSPIVPAPPAGTPEGDPEPEPVEAYGDPGVDPTELPREPLSRYGNPESYEVNGRTYRPLRSGNGHVEEGLASWYGEEFAGRPTSSGETFDPDLLTAAHRTLPLPSWVEVENLDNGRRVVVRVNDRGPFADPDRRILDLSEAAARRIGMVGAGIARVRIRVLASPERSEGGS